MSPGLNGSLYELLDERPRDPISGCLAVEKRRAAYSRSMSLGLNGERRELVEVAYHGVASLEV